MLLGNFYKEGHDAQAEKMLAAGFAHAAKTCNQIVAVSTGSTLKGKYYVMKQPTICYAAYQFFCSKSQKKKKNKHALCP